MTLLISASPNTLWDMLLRQCEGRRQVYFGVPSWGSHPGLAGWLSHCSKLRQREGVIQDGIVSALERIRFRIEVKQKIRDWYSVMYLRRRGRLLEKQRRFKAWLQRYLLTRYRVLNAIVDNLRPLVRYRFWLWKERTKWLRAIDFSDTNCKKRVFATLKLHYLNERQHRLQNRFSVWKRMMLFLRRLKRTVSTDSAAVSCFISCISLYRLV